MVLTGWATIVGYLISIKPQTLMRCLLLCSLRLFDLWRTGTRSYDSRLDLLKVFLGGSNLVQEYALSKGESLSRDELQESIVGQRKIK